MPTTPAPARAWTPDPHAVATAAIAVLDAGDALLTLLGRTEGLAPFPALAAQMRGAEGDWLAASRHFIDVLNDDEEEVLL